VPKATNAAPSSAFGFFCITVSSIVLAFLMDLSTSKGFSKAALVDITIACQIISSAESGV
jgi:hypothetical protein